MSKANLMHSYNTKNLCANVLASAQTPYPNNANQTQIKQRKQDKTNYPAIYISYATQIGEEKKEKEEEKRGNPNPKTHYPCIAFLQIHPVVHHHRIVATAVVVH